MRRRLRGCAALVLGAALLTSGCAPWPGSPAGLAPSGSAAATVSPEPSAPRSTTARDVLIEIVQLRGDVAAGRIELRVTNASDASLTVERAAYDSSRWSAPMVRQDEAEIPPGQRRNLPVELPEPTCDTGPIEHSVTLELADGTVIRQEPADPLEQLERLDDAVCDLRAWEEHAARVEWLDPGIPADGAGAAVVRLRFAPVAETGEQRAALVGFANTVLLTPADASGTRTEVLPLERDIVRGEAPFVVEVPLEPGRCDLHAIAEDKQGTVFRVHAMLGGEPMDLVLPSPEAQREALLDWVVERCAQQP